MTTPSPLVEVCGLTVAYRQGGGWLRVLHGVDLTIGPGEVLGLVGESGCGKSTVAHQLLAHGGSASRVESGRVLFKGTDLLQLDRPALNAIRGDRVSFVPQNPTTALNPSMRVGVQVAEVLNFHGKCPDRDGARVTDLFRLVGLPEPEQIGERYQHQLSGGQQQRVCIAMALACEPDLVVLDEPTTGLDVTTQEQIVALLADLRERLGMSMLYVTHDLGVIAQIADRVGVMYAGRIVEVSPTAELFDSPRHPYSQGLIASVPRLEAAAKRPVAALRGHLKREALPPGCAFAPRCPHAEPACSTERPILEVVAKARSVACHRWKEIGQPEPPPPDDMAEGKGPAEKQPVLSVQDLDASYMFKRRWARLFGSARRPVIEDLSFEIGAGETFALVGESGSGKSTLARAVSGLLVPESGRIVFEGRPLEASAASRTREERRRIQYIFQNPDASLNPRARIDSILARPAQMFMATGRRDVATRVTRVLENVRIDEGYSRRFPDQLSGGERQRVAIARALIVEPTLLICDEILSALDVSLQAEIVSLLSRLRREHHLSLLFISHDLAVVRGLADKVGVLFRGRMMEIGDADQVFAAPFHPYTHALLMAVPSIGSKPRAFVQPTSTGRNTATKGCVFAGRCPWRLGDICDTATPPWRMSGGKRIRCHIPLADLAARAEWPRAKGAAPSDRLAG